jgi:histidine triad (HIT) family protein
MIDEKCIFCLIGSNKVQSAKIFENEECCAFLDINPASKGHVQVISKEHAPLISMLPDNIKSKMFDIALKLGDKIVKNLGASGVSYIINEGAGAGQRVAHASINIIPRYENDNINISWEGIKLDEKALPEYIDSVIKQLVAESPKLEKKETVAQKAPEPKKEEKKDEEIIKIKPRVPKYW